MDKNATPAGNFDLVTKHGLPAQTRWVDFSAYGMALKIGIYSDKKVLVMEGGDAHHEKVAQLGFAKHGEDWIQPEHRFLPQEFISVFPDAVVTRGAHTAQILLDRSETAFVFVGDAPSVRSAMINRIQQKLQPEIWFAHFDALDHDVHGFGSTPEEAVTVVVAGWKELAERENLDEGMIAEYRESISVNRAELGKSYAKGVGDSLWYAERLNGADARFDAIVTDQASPSVPGPR
jgi:hypothetical protein